MLTTTIAGLRARLFRLAATALAIVLGVGFVAGTLVFGATARAAVYDGLARFGRNVDVSVRPAVASTSTDAPTLPSTTLAAVRAVDGIGVADGRLRRGLPLLDAKGRLAGSSDVAGVAFLLGEHRELDPFDLARGRLPERAGEAALAVDTAEQAGYRVGDQITVLDPAQHRQTLTLVGTVDFGSAKDLADQSVAVLTGPDMAVLTAGTGYTGIVATARAGVDPGELAGRVRAVLGSQPRVQTGDRYRFDLANDSVKQLTPFLTAIMLFAVISCVVAAFVIYNTFTILLAQRMRETALLRCVGADRRQVFGSVLLESAVVGLVGSAAGVGLGIAVGYGLVRGSTAVGLPLDTHPLVVTAFPVLVSIAVGTLTTVLSALVPAVRATRVPPLAALGTTPLTGPSGVRGRVLLIGLALLVATGGTLLTVVGSTTEERTDTTVLVVVAGGIVNFLAVLIVSPLYIPALIRLVGWVPARLFGPTARLAVANARRAPGRTAATTAALMIGVGLMSAASITTATVRETADHQLSTNYPVDYLLRAVHSGGQPTGIPVEVAARLDADPRLGLVARTRSCDVTVSTAGDRGSAGDNGSAGDRGSAGDNGSAGDRGSAGQERVAVAAIDPAGLAGLPEIELAAGSLADLRPGTAILNRELPAARGLRIGDRVTLRTADGRGGEFTLVGLSTGYVASSDALISWSDLATMRQRDTDDNILIRAADGVGPQQSRAAVHAVTDDFPLVVVDSVAGVRAQITSVVDTMIAIIGTLLGFAIVIALIGIMNTLSLSVFERTRESATVRALGLTRTQLRLTLLTEAMLMAVAGAIVGVSFGLLYGWAATRVLFLGFDPVIVVPFGQLAWYVGLAAAAGTIAAVLPARRAARAAIVAAMADG